MVVVHRAFGFRFVIYVDDHVPAHVDVMRGRKEAKLTIGEAGESPAIVWNRGLSAADLRRAMREVTIRQDALLAKWKDIHG